jgi:dCMP deaminase
LKEDRLSWEEYAIKLAQTASLRSEDPYMKVGACALGEGNKILSLGYNGLASGKELATNERSLFWDNRDHRRAFMIHAEANCLSMVKSGECTVLASTLLPCSYCATLIAAYKIPKVVYLKEYERDSKAKCIFDFYEIELVKLNGTNQN